MKSNTLEIEKLNTEVVSQLLNLSSVKQIEDLNNVGLTGLDLAIAIAINKIKNPLEMVDIYYVMKDLKLGKNVVYKIFQRPDFPSINIGKSKKVNIVAYTIWKMKRKGW